MKITYHFHYALSHRSVALSNRTIPALLEQFSGRYNRLLEKRMNARGKMNGYNFQLQKTNHVHQKLVLCMQLSGKEIFEAIYYRHFLEHVGVRGGMREIVGYTQAVPVHTSE